MWVLRRWWWREEDEFECMWVGVRGEPVSDAAAGLRRGASNGFLSMAEALGVVWSVEDVQSLSMALGRRMEGR